MHAGSDSTSSSDGGPLQSVFSGNHANRQQAKVQLFSAVAAIAGFTSITYHQLNSIHQFYLTSQLCKRHQAVFQETLPNQQRDVQQSWPSRPEVSLSLLNVLVRLLRMINLCIFLNFMDSCYLACWHAFVFCKGWLLRWLVLYETLSMTSLLWFLLSLCLYPCTHASGGLVLIARQASKCLHHAHFFLFQFI